MPPWLMVLSIASMPVGAALMYFSISRIVRLLRESEVARVPVAAESGVTFATPGTYVLHVEQPRLSLAMLSAKFELRDAATGADVPSSPVIFRTTSGSFSSARLSVRSFGIERAGAYHLVVSGVDPASDVSRVHLIFTHPYAAGLVLLILCTVLGGICLIGGVVLTALQYYGAV
jgi:hypothetical protein